MKLPNIYLYADPSTKTLELEAIASYLQEKLGHSRVHIRTEFLRYHTASLKAEEIARRLTAARTTDPTKRVGPREPLYGEIEYEKRLLKDVFKRPSGVIYDGLVLHSIYSRLIGPEEAVLSDNVHLAFTSRLFATFEEGDGRYHARVILCGFPSIISTAGIVEAPAKPREFYLALAAQSAPSAALAWEGMKERFRGRFIDYDDERMTEVMKGYVMQAIFYHIFHEPFCESKLCRLYNSHWQEEVIQAQLGPTEFCERHAKMLESLRRANLAQL